MRSIGEGAWLDRAEIGRLRDLQLRFADGGLALALENDSWMVIARMMLDEPADREALTQADEQLVERLAAECVEDLCKRLAAAFGLGRAAWRRGAFDALPFAEACIYAVGPSEKAPAVRVIVARDLVAGIVKSSAKPARKLPPLRPLADALAKQEVALSALVGRCELSLGELSGLASGDVLVLDAATGGDLPLAINGTARSGRCKVEQEEGLLRLKIVKPPTGMAQ
jgi:flagellar motor switch/type III secretory pathway protein FliN